MRRFYVALLFILGLSFGGQSAMAADSAPLRFAALEKWVGQYPSVDQRTMKPYPAGQSFWDDPVVAEGIKKSLSPFYANLAKTCYRGPCAENKITKVGNYLMAWVCERASCANNSTRVYINLEMGRTEVCVRTMKSRLSDVTNALDKHQFLPTKAVDFWYYSEEKKGPSTRLLASGECDRMSGKPWLRHLGMFDPFPMNAGSVNKK